MKLDRDEMCLVLIIVLAAGIYGFAVAFAPRLLGANW